MIDILIDSYQIVYFLNNFLDQHLHRNTTSISTITTTFNSFTCTAVITLSSGFQLFVYQSGFPSFNTLIAVNFLIPMGVCPIPSYLLVGFNFFINISNLNTFFNWFSVSFNLFISNFTSSIPSLEPWKNVGPNTSHLFVNERSLQRILLSV